MNYLELNSLIREKINDLVNLGHKKTIIGKLLLGSSGYAPILKFTEGDDLNFGVKPLAKIGETTNYELHLVYLKETDFETIKLINEKNIQFSDELKVKVAEYLNSDLVNPRKDSVSMRKRKTHIDNALTEILNEVFADENPENTSE